MSWRVEVKAYYRHRSWTLHSTWESYVDAVDQARLVGGRILCASGFSDKDAWHWACLHQGFDGGYEYWTWLDDEERDEYDQRRKGGKSC